MQKKPQFKFDVSVSLRNYRNKPTSSDYASMRWNVKTLSVSNFISLILSGYSYCHIYFHNLRRKDKFLHTNIVSIDVDDTDVCLRDFTNTIQLKATFAYETFSNGTDETFSYRLVYVIKERMNAKCFVQVYEKICCMTGLSATKDHCGKCITQLMNGISPSSYCYRSDLIYSIVEDLPVEESFSLMIEKNSEGLIPLVHTDKSPFNVTNNNILHNNIQKQYNTKVHNDKLRTAALDSMLASLREKGRKVFLDYCKPFYKLVRWSRLRFNENGYAVIPENHLSLFVRYSHVEGKAIINRFKDGEKRRNRLFIDGCIIRKIKSEIRIHELFYNLLHRVYWYYDNTDGILSDNLIACKAFDVMEYDVDSMDFKSMNAGSIITSPSYCRNNGVSRKAHSRTALQLENFSRIKTVYDESKSIKENLPILREHGIEASYKTLQRYCHANGIESCPGRKKVSDWYHPWLSV